MSLSAHMHSPPYRSVAALYDIHGNLPALNVVLTEFRDRDRLR
jgi:hypothetical protein